MAHFLPPAQRNGLKTRGFWIACVFSGAIALLAVPATADPGTVQDPTGCATGSASGNCRNLPSTSSGSSSGSRLSPGKSQGLSSGDRLRKSSPLPSQQIQRSPQPLLPPPGSTGLGGGSTGLGN